MTAGVGRCGRKPKMATAAWLGQCRRCSWLPRKQTPGLFVPKPNPRAVTLGQDRSWPACVVRSRPVPEHYDRVELAHRVHKRARMRQAAMLFLAVAWRLIAGDRRPANTQDCAVRFGFP